MSIIFLDHSCTIKFHSYTNGRIAMQLVDIAGAPVATATVNIPEIFLEKDEVLIKNYSENEGIVDALELAGIVQKLKGLTVGYSSEVWLCKLLNHSKN